MRIDPTDAALYTDSGRFLKRLGCPLGKSWMELQPAGRGTRICDSCSRHVHDTSQLNDEDVVKLLEDEPGACLKVSSVQGNCTVIQTWEGIRK